MYLPLVALAGTAAAMAGLVAWAMARRYGRRRALVVPVLAIASAAASVVLSGAADPDEALARVAVAAGFAGPAVAGSLLGLALAGRKGGR